MIKEYNILDKNTIFPNIDYTIVRSNNIQYKYIASCSTLFPRSYEGNKYLVKIVVFDIYLSSKNINRRIKGLLRNEINKRISEYKIERWMLDHSLLEFIKVGDAFNIQGSKLVFKLVDYIKKDILNQSIKKVDVKLSSKVYNKIKIARDNIKDKSKNNKDMIKQLGKIKVFKGQYNGTVLGSGSGSTDPGSGCGCPDTPTKPG